MSKTIYYNQLKKRQQKEILYELMKHSYYSEYNDDLQQFTEIKMPNGDIVKFRFYHDLLPSLYYIPEVIFDLIERNTVKEMFNIDYDKLGRKNLNNLSKISFEKIKNARIVPVSYPKTREESLALIDKWFPEDKLYTKLETEYKNLYELDENSLEFKFFIAEHRAGLSVLEKNVLFKYREIRRIVLLGEYITVLDNSFLSEKHIELMPEKVRYLIDKDFVEPLDREEVKILREVMKLLLPITIEKITDKKYNEYFTQKIEDKKLEKRPFIHMLGDEIYKEYLNDKDEENEIEEKYEVEEDEEISGMFDYEKVTPIIFKPEEEQDIDYFKLNLKEDYDKYVDED